MHAFEPVNIRDQDLCFSADRSIYWEQQRSLIVSDLHFGKTGHFRKAGIAVPQSVFKEDIQRLIAQIQYFKASALIVVGDMFHSYANKELELFARWRSDFADLQILLVRGNHDILNRKWYRDTGIEVHEEKLTIDSFCFQHDQASCVAEDHYVFSGHIHPGITLNGMGKQSLKFPCFYLTDNHCILPAFSRFTGTVSMWPKKNEVVLAIVNQSLVRISS